MSSCLLTVVVPVYGEEQTLPRFLAATRPVRSSVTEVVFIADPWRRAAGSTRRRRPQHSGNR